MSEPQHLIRVKAQLQAKRMPLYQKLIRWMWRLLLGGIAAVIVFLIFLNFTAIPSFRDLEDPKSALASEVLANDNREVLGRYFRENRVPVAYEKLNPYLVKALISTEDERFFEHCGIDYRAIGRVAVRTVLMGDKSAGGGSTITQQLAKMLYSDRNFTGMNKLQKAGALVYRKLREWITAVKLERSYTKEEIIALYLNQVDFVNNAVGVQSAAEIYFDKDQKDLSIHEAALLVGMLQNPSYFSPLRNPEKCLRRRLVVLNQMRIHGHLSEAQYAEYRLKPIDMSRFKKILYGYDKAPYLCASLAEELKRMLNQPEYRKPDGSKYDLFRDGLKVYTTIDPAYQDHAEAAMREQMKKLQERFFTVWKGRDPWAYRSGNATDQEIENRKNSFWDLVRSTERYAAIRPRYLDAISERIQEKYDMEELRDVDILRMLREDKKSGTMAEMMRVGEVSPSQGAVYRRILAGSEWPILKRQWTDLLAFTERTMKTPVEMKVFTWDNPQCEKVTRMSPWDSLRYHRMFLQTGMIALDPGTSEIKAWVGGINFKYFKFDHTNTERQVGSTFKPFVYATAISQQGVSPCFQVYDNPVTIPGRYQHFSHVSDWTPKNSTGSYSGARLTLRDALKNSVNSVSAYLMKQLGDTEPVRGLVNNMGIDSSSRRRDGQHRIPKQPSICLGVADLTVQEMAGAYATFANKGMYGKPYVIRKIEDKNGRVIFRSIPEERAALAENANYVMVDMLKYNVKGAPGVNTLKSEVGGKTGTTNDYSDGWFVGVTPRLTVATWVGGDDRWMRFLNLGDGQGAKMARPIFAGFLQRLEKDPNSGYDYNARFVRPPGDLGIEIDCGAYLNGPAPTGDEEEFSPDIYNDEVPPEGEPPAPAKPGQKPVRKPDDDFGN